MIRYALIEPNTGAIVQTGTGPDVEHLTLQAQVTGLQAIEAPDPAVTDASHYWTGTGFAAYPPRPGEWAVWDGNVWIDPRSPADLAADLTQRRHATQLDKSDLLIRLAVAGILSPEGAEEAAGGTIPASMLPMLEALPPDAQMAARVKWRADTTISRTHPVIVAAAYALGVSDAQLDQIFGVADPLAATT